jgi:hypothetical protein
VVKRHPQEWIAAAVMAVVVTLMVLDLVDHSFNSWFDRHSFSTDTVSTLLGLAVAALVVDRISDRRRLEDRAQVMAAQGAMIGVQALRATQAVTSVLDGSGDRNAARDELQTFTTMMLTGAPVLMDAPQTREFLEDSERLAAELARALALTRSGERPDDLDQRVNDAAGQVQATVAPLRRLGRGRPAERRRSGRRPAGRGRAASKLSRGAESDRAGQDAARRRGGRPAGGLRRSALRTADGPGARWAKML